MTSGPRLQFISLFVPNLAAAAERYERFLRVSPCAAPPELPAPHPFAAAGPVVFRLGETLLALYQCDGRTTHSGDVGIGVAADLDATCDRLVQVGGRLFWGPSACHGDTRLAVGVLPDRHFFELVDATAVADDAATRPPNQDCST